jgi:RNA polymerase sigma-32 factor
MEVPLNNYDVPFDGFDPEDDERPAAHAAYLADRRLEPFAELEREDTETNERDQLYTTLDGLDERSKAILEARWLSEKTATLHELAEHFSVSAERIRQIGNNAIEKLKKRLVASGCSQGVL